MTWGDGLAIYAVIISTAVGFIHVLRFFRDTRSKLVVDLSIYDEDSVNGDNDVISQTIVRVNIVNHSSSDRVITGPPWLNVDKSGMRIKLYTSGELPVVGPFPKRLVAGDACECLYDIRSIKVLAKEQSASKLRATVDDTYGNQYKSKWVKFSWP